jgi:muramoyltetrapeptide carboxypeptidase
MQRRSILKSSAFLPLLSQSLWASVGFSAAPRAPIKPARLQPGQTIGLIAPSGPVSATMLESIMEQLTKLGYKYKLGLHVRERYGYLAGSDAQRAADLNAAFADPEVDAIFALRGGYGGTRILSRLDYTTIRRNPKIFIGYSDITAFHTAFHQRTGLVTFHGPVGNLKYTDFTQPYVWEALTNPAGGRVLQHSAINTTKDDPVYRREVITPGRAQGRLVGGNLTLLAAMAGTPYALKDVKGKILFMEEVEEKPYRVDRMLTQLMQTVDLRTCAGIALGIFEGCGVKPGDSSLTLHDTLRDRLGGLGVPVFYGYSFGHIPNQFTLPVGVEAEMDTDKQTITLLEGAVV